ncbi:MAG: bifunctional metallophosphatase/5'-nucleotidase, partial [Endomicrobiales bacterium]
PAQDRAGRSGSFTLLHTNDFHGRCMPFEATPPAAAQLSARPGEKGFSRRGKLGGLACLASMIKAVRQQQGKENVILVHSGDTFSDDLLCALNRGEAVISAMNAMGYQFMALGDHDFDYGLARTRQLQKRARFPMRGANVIVESTQEVFLGEPFRILTAGNVRVALLALGYHNTGLATDPENVRGLAFTKGVIAATKYVGALRKKADVVVVVSHMGSAMDRVLARNVPGIDIIVGGHSHELVEERVPAANGGTVWITQLLPDGAMLGEVTVSVEKGKLVSVKGKARPAWNDACPPDPEIALLLERYRSPYRERLEHIITVSVDRIERQARSESPVDKIAARVLRRASGADIAFLPGASFGVPLTPGAVTREKLYAFMPHPSRVVTMSLKGRQVRELLERSAANLSPENPLDDVGGLIQTDGVKWAVDLARPLWNRVKEISVGGEPLDEERDYRVVTNNALFSGLHRYATFKAGTDTRRYQQSDLELLEAELEGVQILTQPEQGDITVLHSGTTGSPPGGGGRE